MTNSKRKGKNGELELVKVLKDYGYDCRRSVQYNGKAEEGQPDILGLPGIHIECKRVEAGFSAIHAAMEQAVRDADDKVPAVFHRQNKKPWLVTMTLDDWIKLYWWARQGTGAEDEEEI